MKRAATVLALVVAWAFAANLPNLPRAAAQGWAPPAGVPRPAFGIDEACPSATVTVPAGSLPPSTVAAGVTVRLLGARSGTATVTFAGTASSPACVVGEPGNTWTGGEGLIVRGQYGIAEGIVFTGGAHVSMSGHHLSVRGNSITGTLAMQRTSCLGGSSISDSVIWRNLVTRCGDVAATFDQDAHGISIGRGGLRVWIVDNETSYHSGDGMQVNPYPYTDSGLYSSTRFVYFGRNHSHHNKQSCQGLKGSSDIIVSENDCHDIGTSNSSLGQGLSYQYGSDRVWFIRNRIRNVGQAIWSGGDFDANGANPASIYVVDNVMDGITGQGGTSGTWAGAPIFLSAGKAQTWVVGNTATNSTRGINSPRGVGLMHADNTGLPILSDRPVSGTTSEAVYAAFESLYGLSIRPGPPASPTPSPVPSPSPSISPSPSPTPSPVPSPSPSPSTPASPTPSPSPSPTPSPSPSVPPCAIGEQELVDWPTTAAGRRALLASRFTAGWSWTGQHTGAVFTRVRCPPE